MQICDSCRLYSYRHVPVKSAQQLAPIDNEMPDNTITSLATSGNDLKGIPLATSRYDLEEISAASLVSTSSRHSNLPDDLRNQNVDTPYSKISLECEKSLDQWKILYLSYQTHIQSFMQIKNDRARILQFLAGSA